MNPDPVTFVARWSSSGAAERANYQLFLSELCDLLGVPRPEPTKPDDADNAYVFERSVTFHHPDGSTSTGRIDLYKRACFVLEAKQGVEKRDAEDALADATRAKAKAAKKGTAQRGSAAWDEAMLKARGQAEQYARALPASEGRPPLLIVVDVGHSIELYSEFTRTGGTYVPFPDPQSHRLLLDKLSDPAVRETLRLAWTDPQALDPARRSARVTRDIAEKLGRLAASLEKSGHSAEAVATFLMRALFTMFAEDVELLPKESFIHLLKSLEGRAEQFAPMVEELWSRMQTGGFSTVLREKVRHFNGGLFEQATALPLTDDQFALLLEASHADWRDVEPAIFGTLLERALDAHERHKLGAHYTPRGYVERLVLPTVVEPLRAEWDAVKAAAVTLDRAGKTKDAAAEVQRFHRHLCEVRVLDPACGSGNFLYVTLEHLKRLEGEVLNALDRLGHEQAALEMAGFTVDPHQLLGLEVNPRAAAIAELVLWIGYLQWHFRTRGRVAPPEPIIKAFHNIECRDAVLACDGAAPVLDESGAPVTRWDGRTTKPHPITGEEVPDESARVPLLSYQNTRPADWPQADFIVGNPPFIGTARMRDALGDGYTEAVRAMYPDVPESADFVMYWWHKAATRVRQGNTTRFGLITTNSLRQTFNRRVLEHHLGGKPVSVCQIGSNAASQGGLRPGSTPNTPGMAGSDTGGESAAPAVSAARTLAMVGSDTEGESVAPAVSTTRTLAMAGSDTGGESAAPAVSAARTLAMVGSDTEGESIAPAVSAACTLAMAGSDAGGESTPPAGKLCFTPSTLPPLSLRFAIPDHPWVDSADGAAVRIAMTVGAAGSGEGRLAEVVEEIEHGEDAAEVTLRERIGLLHANLAIGANVAAAVPLEANSNLSNRGFELGSAGFIVTQEEAVQLGLGRVEGIEKHIRPYINGRDMLGTSRDAMLIDLFGLDEADAQARFPEVWQWLRLRVLPDRMENRDERLRANWWLHRRSREDLRNMLAGLPRYIATVETAKHRLFQFLDASIAPDNMLVVIASDDAFSHGVLSSRIHVLWALATGGRLGVGNDPRYNKTRCFETFPFPEATEAQRARIRDLAERLDAHRKRQQSLHPKLTLTDMYNVLEKLRTGAALTAKEQTTHEHGLVSVLRQLHDDLDATVAEAYGLAPTAPDDAILDHLCALNAQRAAEERAGHIRWLRPAFQNPTSIATQATLATESSHEAAVPALAKAATKLPWPKSLADQAQAIRAALTAPIDAAMLAKSFKGAKADRVADILETLASLGQARALKDGRYVTA